MPLSNQLRQQLIKQPQSAFGQVLKLLQAGQTVPAWELAKDLVALVPDFVNAHVLLSQISQQLQRGDEALLQARRAQELAPEHNKACLQLAACLVEEGIFSEAFELLQSLEKRGLNDALLCVLIANIYVQANAYEDACACFTRSVQLRPEDAETWHLYSGALAGLGRIDEADEALARVLALQPLHFEALLSRANLRKQSAAENHIASLKSALQKTRDKEGRVLICYALAKELEDLNEFEESFRFLRQGADINDRLLNYDVGKDCQSIVAFTEIFAAKIQDLPSPASGGAGMIFILGLPRSGSTLCDRILGSHSRVESLGETSDFHYALLAKAGRASRGGKLPFIDALANIDYQALGQSYMARVAKKGKVADFLIDKTPNNALYLGLIKKALPEARIIYTCKNPMDACYSLYKAVFKQGYPFSYNLEKLGRYYIAFDEMMRFWQSRPKLSYKTLAYEALVEDQVAESRQLLTYCGLDWEDACLDFYRAQSATATASVIQVRQPIYRSALGKWRHFESHLAGLRGQLSEAGIVIDKEPGL